MGTLTVGCPRLDSHCLHKLATSCRLTSTPNCCACADERSHSRTYSVYIDGIGFVQRGTRWQSYCWFCKEFWNNRIAATDPPITPEQTRIPHVPDQTGFVERWFEFHQGYRVVTLEDGTEQRIAVLGEDLREVSPGFLPRSLDDLRMRRANDAQRPENRFRRRRLSSEQERADEPLPSLENELDRLLEAASEPDDTSLEIPQRPAMPDDPGHSSQLVEVDSSPVTVPPRQSRAAARRERFARIFGTREDIERDDYESPIASMYYRAYTRYLEAEETRAAGDTDVAEADSERHDLENQILQSTIAASRRREPAPANVPRGAFQTTADWSNRTHSPLEPLALQDPAQTPVTRQTSTAPVTTTEPVPPARETREAMEALEYSDMPRAARAILENVMQTLDLTPRGISIELDMDKQNRPPPLEDADMTRSLSCRVCYSQLADVALLPCGHMVLCTWCADTIVPVKHSHIPISSQCACPVCKKTVKQRYRIHM